MTAKVFSLFLPCAGGVEQFLQQEVQRIINKPAKTTLGGILIDGCSKQDVMLLNLKSRLAQRVLIQLVRKEYRIEDDIYLATKSIAWDNWFTAKNSFKVEITARKSPLKSLNFIVLRIKDGIVDQFRDKYNLRPSVDRTQPDVRVYAHLTNDRVTIYLDTSGQPLFKRGWRLSTGDAPLKETLAAAMLFASGWDGSLPLYDPCCGSGTILIEAAQILCNIAPGLQREFAFVKLIGFDIKQWQQLRQQAQQAVKDMPLLIYGSDVSHRMVDFAQQNAKRAGVEKYIQFRGGDALQRLPPTQQAGIMLLNPPYGERIGVAGIAKANNNWQQQTLHLKSVARQQAVVESEEKDFFVQLASHWKQYFANWQAWLLVPDMKLPSKMRLKESKRTPLWNGAIECRLFCFALVKGSARKHKATNE